MILGIDEVGRGAWAGPLVVGAVILGGRPISGLTDSKQLSKINREELDVIIREQAIAYALGWVDANEIDHIGMAEALKLATIRAVQQINAPYHEIIIDGTVNFLADTRKGRHVTLIKRADALIPSVSAASIIAKVARDKFMSHQAEINKEYSFESNVGYGTEAHKRTVEKIGVTPIHRLSFKPLKKFRPNLSGGVSQETVAGAKLSTKQKGCHSENIVANYLIREGHNILDRNWKTKFCEIDIVSQKNGTIYFTEVKYRKNSIQGTGLDNITKKKLKQMKFASGLYSKTHQLYETDILLAVASLSGKNPQLDVWFSLD